jgi:7-carboxy-7-deazaguanine synthase (Cx14CxxC type)
MGYAVKEVFYTLQGEGMNAGRAAVFCRFAGCNLWSGRAEDRHRAACSFCDTDFVGTDGTGGGRFRTADDLADAIQASWRGPSAAHRFAVLTGGEPLLQVDGALIAALHTRGFEIAVETNGTIEPPEGIDWICVSPKTLPLAASRGHELKLVYPNPRVAPSDVEGLGFRHLLLQPMDDADGAANTAAAVAFCLDNPHWRLTLQNHKHVGIR